MTLRRPVVAGTFYPAEGPKLKGAIEASFLHRLGPRRLPRGDGVAGGLGACVCPHAGYAYSGPVAAHSYLDLSRLRRPDLVVIVGPNHYGIGSGVATYGEGDWETPLGTVRVDPVATKEILKSGAVDLDPQAHSREHSIEVQLPFLQALYGDGLSFLPISLGFQDKSTARDLGRAIAHILTEAAEGKSTAILIASSDLTHYEPASQAREKDTSLLKHVEALEVDAFYTELERKDITACGYGAIATAMEACRHLGLKRGRLNAYATSGDVTGDEEAVVGYPSVTFVR